MDAAASLLLGSRCPGCGCPAARLCGGCAAVLAAATPTVWGAPGHDPPVLVCAAYDQPWRGCLLAFKERGAWWLAQPLGGVAALGVAALLLRRGTDGDAAPGRRLGGDAPASVPGHAAVSAPAARAPGPPVGSAAITLVPVPSNPATVRLRGWDTTRGLTVAAARRLRAAGLRVRVDAALRQARPVADQAGLSSSARAANLRGAHAARRAPPGPVVIVDDLTTTGASFAEAARALRAAGCQVWGCVAVAGTPRRDGR